MNSELNLHDPNYPDPIIEGIRDTKRKLAAECNHDLRKMFDEVRRQEEADDRNYVQLPPRPAKSNSIPPLEATPGNSIDQPTP